MKILIIPLIASLSVLLWSCSSEEEEVICEDITCASPDCLFVINGQEAETTFLTCFGRWGYWYQIDEYWVALIPDSFDSNLEEAGLHINICGRARENTIPIQFPDPMIGEVYQFETLDLQMQ
jgi:hypothetical protein